MQDLDAITPDDLEALSDHERRALLSGETHEAPTQEVEAPKQEDQTQGVSVPQPEPTVQQQGNKGDLNVALRQEREHRRQLESQLQQVQSALQDPRVIAQLAAQHAPQASPELAIEDPKAIQAIVQQHVAPLHQTIQQMQALLAKSEQDKQMMALKSQYPDLDDVVSEFDQTVPHLAGKYSPQEKYLMALGGRVTDKGYLDKLVQDQAAKLAEAKVASALGSASGKNANPVTLSGVTPSQSNDKDVDPTQISDDDWDKLSDKDRRKYLGG